MSKTPDQYNRAITTYSATLSLLGVIDVGGLAATATILQLSKNSWFPLALAAAAFLGSLVACLFAMTCLTGQAEKENPDIHKGYLKYSAFWSIFLMALGAVFLFIGIYYSKDQKSSVEDKACNCFCTPPMSSYFFNELHNLSSPSKMDNKQLQCSKKENQ